MMLQRGKFLTAEWQKLLMVNYEVNPAVLAPYIPAGTVVDFFEGKTYLSIVGFMFRNTRILGIKIPFHVDFEEVNLRFYVKRILPEGEVRRGVVFIKEIVPRTAIALTANWAYREHYAAQPMSHHIQNQEDSLTVAYNWRYRKYAYSITAQADNNPLDLVEGSEAQFITEHYWGYSRYNHQKQ
jgi:hypothetical protein